MGFYSRFMELLTRGERRFVLFRMFAFFLLVLPGVVMGGHGLADAYRFETQASIDRHVAEANLHTRVIKDRIQVLVDLTRSFADRPSLRTSIENGSWDEAARELDTVKPSFPFVERMFLSDVNGEFKADYPISEGLVGHDFSHRDWYVGVSKNWTPYVSEVYVRTKEPKIPVVAVAAPIFSGEGDVLGILVLQVNVPSISEWFFELSLEPGEEVIIVDQRGSVVVHSGQAEVETGASVASFPPAQRALAGQSGYEITVGPFDDVERLALYNPILPFGWVVLTEPDVSQVFVMRDARLARSAMLYGAILTFNALLAYGIILVLQLTYQRTNLTGKLQSEELRRMMSEERYREIFLSSRDAIMTLEPPHWRFTSANPATVAMFRTKGEKHFLSYEPWALSPERQPDGRSSAEKAREMIEVAMREGTHFFEWTHRRFDGEDFPAEVLLSRVGTGDKAFLHAVVRDITERKALERAAFGRQEEKFKAIFDRAQDGILIADLETKRFVDANPAMVEMLGYPHDEFLRLGIADIHPKDALQAVMRQFERQASGVNTDRVDLPVLRKDGVVLFADISASTIVLNGRKCVVGIFHDVSARRRAERHLKESEDRYHTLFHSMDEGFASCESVSGTGKRPGGFRFLSVNPTFTKLVGLPEETILGKNILDILPEIDPSFVDTLNQVVRTGKSERFVDTILVHGKLFRVFAWRSAPGRFGMLLNDVTRIREMELKVIEEKAREDAILYSIGDAVFACDTRGSIILFNKIAEELTGVSAAEALGKPYKQVVNFSDADDLSVEYDYVADAFVSRTKGKTGNRALLVRNDGRRIPVADSAAPVRGPDGTVLGCVVVFRDVTHEQEVDRAKSEFVSLTSHQLRTPLTTISWYVEMLLDGKAGPVSEPQKKYLNEVARGTKRMVELVGAFLDVSRLELGTFVFEAGETDVRACVQTVLDDLRPQMEAKSLVFKETYASHLPPVTVDPKLLRVVLQNVLANAVKYTPDEGRITLSVTWEKKRGNVVITVTDTGYGIPKDQQDKIFMKLFRADNVRQMDAEGTGLGLYIAKAIVDRSGGTIRFESEENKGTTFFITLPVSGASKL